MERSGKRRTRIKSGRDEVRNRRAEVVGEARRRSEADANAKAVPGVEQVRFEGGGNWRWRGGEGVKGEAEIARSCGTKQKPVDDTGMVTLAWAAHHIRPESCLRVR